jgi:hypothetical protein
MMCVRTNDNAVRELFAPVAKTGEPTNPLEYDLTIDSIPISRNRWRTPIEATADGRKSATNEDIVRVLSSLPPGSQVSFGVANADRLYLLSEYCQSFDLYPDFVIDSTALADRNTLKTLQTIHCLGQMGSLTVEYGYREFSPPDIRLHLLTDNYIPSVIFGGTIPILRNAHHLEQMKSIRVEHFHLSPKMEATDVRNWTSRLLDNSGNRKIHMNMRNVTDQSRPKEFRASNTINLDVVHGVAYQRGHSMKTVKFSPSEFDYNSTLTFLER